MQRHATPHLEHICKRSFSVGIKWLGGRSLHTTRSIAQIFVGVLFDVSSHLYDLCCGSNCIYFYEGTIVRRLSLLLSFPCLTFPCLTLLDLLVYDLPFFSSTWLSPLLSSISSSLPLLLPFYLSTFSLFQPRSSREFAISP